MSRSLRLKLGSGVAVALIAAAAFLVAASGDDGDRPITGDALQKAGAAALEHTGGGEVTGTEVGDEESYYEVEVTLEDGSRVDVQLDDDFKVVDSREDEGTEED